jgi:NADH:ubiquinone oxidoreductase subunit 3 (subunit A)
MYTEGKYSIDSLSSYECGSSMVGTTPFKYDVIYISLGIIYIV